SADTRPPGEVRQAVRPPGSVTRSTGSLLATTTNAAVGEVVNAPPHACHMSLTRPRGPHVSAATRRVAPPNRAADVGPAPGRACSSRRDERGDAVECSVDHIVGVVLVRVARDDPCHGRALAVGHRLLDVGHLRRPPVLVADARTFGGFLVLDHPLAGAAGE